MILYTEKPFDVEVKRITDGRGVDVVYDSVGEVHLRPEPELAPATGLMVSVRATPADRFAPSNRCS